MIAKRYVIANLCYLGFIITVGLRTNTAFATLSMVQWTNKGGTTFDWKYYSLIQVDLYFCLGYIVTQIPGGFLATKYPANRIFGTAILVSALLHMLIPPFAHVHKSLVIIVGTLQGLVEGVTYPAYYGILRYWAPPMERSQFATIVFSGTYSGYILGSLISAALTDYVNWQVCFYSYGLLAIIWYFFWHWLTFEKPSKHPSITQEELMFIENSLGQMSKSLPTFKTTPWKAMFTSMPVWAIITMTFCNSFIFYILAFMQPRYFSEVLQLDSYRAYSRSFWGRNFTVGHLPLSLMTIIVPLGGYLADMMRRNEFLTTTNVRKLFSCGGFGLIALLLVVIVFVQNPVVIAVHLTLAVIFNGFAISGFQVNHLDLAPRYASILMGMSNVFRVAALLIVSTVIPRIIFEKDYWKWAFLLASGMHFVGVIFYGIFASGESQSWAEPSDAEIPMKLKTSDADHEE